MAAESAVLQILLELERLRNPYSGLGQYCQHLATALAALPEAAGTRWQYLLPAAQVGALDGEADLIAVRPWHKFFPPRSTARLWHCLHQDSAYLPPRNSAASLILTIHDLNFLERPDWCGLEKKRRLTLLQCKINRSQGLVCISRYVQQQVENQLIVPKNTLQKVIYNGGQEAVNEGWNGTPQATHRSPLATQVPFVFSIGLHPKKNYHALLPILVKNPDLHWVIAGGDHAEYRKKIQREAARQGIAERLHFVGTVSEAAKCDYYGRCEALLFPSLAEGFGLPVVEAMSFGKPVFLSIRTSLPEIGGPDAFYFQTFDPEHVVSVFERGMADFRADPAPRRARLLAWAAQFTWEQAAREYWGFYEDVLRGLPPSAPCL